MRKSFQIKEHLLKQPKVVKNVDETKKVWVNLQKTIDSEVVPTLMAGVNDCFSVPVVDLSYLKKVN